MSTTADWIKTTDDAIAVARKLKTERDALVKALKPLIEAHRRACDPGTADLDPEQPWRPSGTLGDWRKLDMAYSTASGDRGQS